MNTATSHLVRATRKFSRYTFAPSVLCRREQEFGSRRSGNFFPKALDEQCIIGGQARLPAGLRGGFEAARSLPGVFPARRPDARTSSVRGRVELRDRMRALRSPARVAVLPYDPGRGKVVLLEQFRVVDEPGRLLRGPSDHVGRVDSRAAAGVHGLGHETEDIRTHVIDLDTVIRGLDDGSIRNAATIIAVQWLELHRSVLDASWLS